jgi:endo-1,4-beta-mannosidase
MQRNSAKLLSPDGSPLLWVGVNYWSRTGGPLMWRHYDGAVVDEELRTMRDHGVTLTRSFLYWPDFMPEESTLDPAMLERFDDFLERHAALGMHTVPTFLVGHMSGQNWDPAWRDGRDVFADASFVAQQEWYVRETTARWKDHPAVAGWLLTNEVPIYADWPSRGIGTLDAATVTSWANTLVGAVRSAGATQPVSIGDGAWGVETSGADNGFRIRDLAPLVDFHGPHVYNMETDAVRQHLGAAFVCELLDIGGKPVILEEFGLTSDYVSEENAAHYYRQILHNSLLAGATGWIAWNNTDYDALEEQEPYSHHPFEMHFGITDSEGRPKEQLREVKRFTEVLRRTDAARLHRPPARAAIVVSSFLERMYPFTQPDDRTSVAVNTRQAYVAAREADLGVGLAREADGLPDDCALYLLPSAKQLTAPGWTRLRALAESGATVYASYFAGEHAHQRGAWWPKLDETFGVRKQLRYGLADPIEDDELRMVFTRDLGLGPAAIRAGEELVFPVTGTENSAPTSPSSRTAPRSWPPTPTAAPRCCAAAPRAAASSCSPPTRWSTWPPAPPRVNPEPSWRLYAALAAEAGVAPEVTVPGEPRVMVARMDHEDGRAFVWFVSQHDQPLTAHPALARGALLSLDGRERLNAVELPPFGVVVAELTSTGEA